MSFMDEAQRLQGPNHDWKGRSSKDKMFLDLTEGVIPGAGGMTLESFRNAYLWGDG